MSAETQINFDGLDKVEVSIARLKQFEPADGYWLAFSGGKDSVVLYDLAVKSGVKFVAHYNITNVDPPDLVHFIKREYPQVIFEHPEMTMWELIAKKGLPYRKKRFCCAYLKEGHGTGAILTGVRHEESSKRAKRCVFEYANKSTDKWFINPIIDWKETEIWSYIHSYHVPYCNLYDEGWKRIGCMLCPFSKDDEKQLVLAKYPKVVENYRRAFRRFCETHPKKNLDNPDIAFDRWFNETSLPSKEQLGMFV